MKTVTPRRLSIPMALFVVCGMTFLASAQTNRTLRIVCYNIEADTDGNTTPLPGLIAGPDTNTIYGGVLEGIGEENVGPDPAQPIDILALEETTSNTATVAPIVNGLNAYYNAPGMYAMSTYQATESGGNPSTGNGPNALVYNTTTVQLLASHPVDPPGGTSALGSGSGEYREVMRYEFAPAGVTPTTANEFYIYVSHYKADTGTQNQTYRAGEATIIRNDEKNNLLTTARVLYVGDYNISTSGEASYQIIITNAAPNGVVKGGGIDPMNLTGSSSVNWTANSLLNLKTESATSLSARFDFQIMTTNVYYGTPGGLAYVPGTYHVFGNNGTTAYHGSVNSGTDTALTNLVSSASYPYSYITAATLYSYLTTASDHLPVVADYTIPIPAVAPMASFTATPTNGVAALTVNFTDTSSGSITNWAWTFGDGGETNLTTAGVAYTYNTPGTYSVTEVVSGSGGVSTYTVLNYITVLAPPTLPAVQVTEGAGGVILTWPIPTMPYQLLSAPTILGPWSPAPDTLTTNGGSVTVTISPTSTQYYYRLQGQ